MVLLFFPSENIDSEKKLTNDSVSSITFHDSYSPIFFLLSLGGFEPKAPDMKHPPLTIYPMKSVMLANIST